MCVFLKKEKNDFPEKNGINLSILQLAPTDSFQLNHQI